MNPAVIHLIRVRGKNILEPIKQIKNVADDINQIDKNCSALENQYEAVINECLLETDQKYDLYIRMYLCEHGVGVNNRVPLESLSLSEKNQRLELYTRCIPLFCATREGCESIIKAELERMFGV